MRKIILFYKYMDIKNPEKIKQEQILLCGNLNLKGRGIIAKEGINFTLEGTEKEVNNYKLTMNKIFQDIHFKESESEGNAFPKLSIKVRDEIVTARLGKDDVNPNFLTGKYLSAEELHNWYENKKEFIILDMRNGFEQEVGYFENSLLSQFARFDELPKIIPQLKKDLLEKDIPIVTVCTGGVRCEKASGFLLNCGFKNVYQLFGGIHSYMEKYPNGYFRGSLYVFDQRVVMGFNFDDQNREVLGRCAKCDTPSENYINCKDPFCNRHFIACKNCLIDGKILCPMGCRDYSKEHPEAVKVY